MIPLTDRQDEFIHKSIMRDMSEGVLIIGLDGTLQYINPAAADILGKNTDELLSRKIASFFFEDARNDAFSQTIVDAINDVSSPHYNLVSYYVGNQEKTLYVMTSFLLHDQERIALIVLLNDMTNLAAMRKHYTEQLITLLDSLVQALSVSIDERSNYNGRHTQHMVQMAEAFLRWLDRTNHPWRFDDRKKHAFVMSVRLHDIGKLSVPLEIMDKSTRLGDALARLEERFRRIHLLKRIALLEGRLTPTEWEQQEQDDQNWLKFVQHINTSGFLSEEDLSKVLELSQQHYTEEDGTPTPYLTPQETACLTIRKGTLTDEERSIMQNHVVVTQKILDQVSFPEEYAMVPAWASAHHELKNGKGYPKHLKGDDIPKEVCLLTILDIFEALTSKDRPYKQPIPLEKAWAILHSMAEDGSLDAEILTLFQKSGAWHTIF